MKQQNNLPIQFEGGSPVFWMLLLAAFVVTAVFVVRQATYAPVNAATVKDFVLDESTQYDCKSDLPTRPLNWWSCESPNLSAFSITITVAFGTSTPTSTTVVETRISYSLFLNFYR